MSYPLNEYKCAPSTQEDKDIVFDCHKIERNKKGAEEYGESAYRNRDCLQEAYEELIDLENWFVYHRKKLLDILIRTDDLTDRIKRIRND